MTGVLSPSDPHGRNKNNLIFMRFFSCVILYKETDNGGLVISSDGNNKPHVNDIYIHSESMCCQRWCDTFPDWGSCYGNMTHHKSSCFTCASCTVLMKAISCSFCLPTSSAEPQRSITHHIRCLGRTQCNTSAKKKKGVCCKCFRNTSGRDLEPRHSAAVIKSVNQRVTSDSRRSNTENACRR